MSAPRTPRLSLQPVDLESPDAVADPVEAIARQAYAEMAAALTVLRARLGAPRDDRFDHELIVRSLRGVRRVAREALDTDDPARERP